MDAFFVHGPDGAQLTIPCGNGVEVMLPVIDGLFELNQRGKCGMA